MIWLLTLVSLLFGWLALRDIDWPTFSGAFSLLEPAWFAGFVLCMLGMVHLRAWRWEHMIRPLIPADTPARRLRFMSWVGFAAVIVLPLRAGEFVRPSFFRGTPDRPSRFGDVLGALLVERVLDGLLLVLIIALAFTWRLAMDGFFAPVWALTVWLATTFLFLSLLGILVCIVISPDRTRRVLFSLCGLFWLARRLPWARRLQERLENTWERLATGLTHSLVFRHLWIPVLATLAYWGFNALGVAMAARAFGLPITLDATLLVLGFSAVGVFLPGAPGHWGNFHEFARLGLSTRFSHALITGPGMAFVVTLHAVQIFLYLLLGLIGLLGLRQDGEKKGPVLLHPVSSGGQRTQERLKHRPNSEKPE